MSSRPDDLGQYVHISFFKISNPFFSHFCSSKKIHHSGDKVHPNEVKALLTNNKVHPNEVTKALMTNGVIKNSNADLKPKSSPSEDDDDDENNDHTNAEVKANETSIMNLLLAAAAKSQKQPNGMAKAVSV